MGCHSPFELEGFACVSCIPKTSGSWRKRTEKGLLLLLSKKELVRQMGQFDMGLYFDQPFVGNPIAIVDCSFFGGRDDTKKMAEEEEAVAAPPALIELPNGEKMPPLADGDYDAVVLGTGLKECIISGLLSTDKLRVLHIDRNNYYGGASASLNLKQVYERFKGGAAPPAALGDSRDYNIDMIPKVRERSFFSFSWRPLLMAFPPNQFIMASGKF